MAKGSAGELRSMIILAEELNKIEKEKKQELFSLSLEISKLLSSFIKSL